MTEEKRKDRVPIPDPPPITVLPELSSLGERLRWAIQTKGGESLAEFARRFGVPRPQLSRWVNDPTAPPREGTLNQLADYLGVPISWLRYGVAPHVEPLRRAVNEHLPPGLRSTPAADALYSLCLAFAEVEAYSWEVLSHEDVAAALVRRVYSVLVQPWYLLLGNWPEDSPALRSYVTLHAYALREVVVHKHAAQLAAGIKAAIAAVEARRQHPDEQGEADAEE